MENQNNMITLAVVLGLGIVLGLVLGGLLSTPSEKEPSTVTLEKDKVQSEIDAFAQLVNVPFKFDVNKISKKPVLVYEVVSTDPLSGQNISFYFDSEYRLYAIRPDTPEKPSEMLKAAQQLQAKAEQGKKDPKEVDISGSASQGDENASIVVVEFSDFQCPFCKKFHDTVYSDFVEQYVKTGKVKFVYKHFPLSSIHPFAQKAAEASECARDQGKFWEYHDTLFENQDALSIDDLKKYAEELGLDVEQFSQCLDSGKYESLVASDVAEGQKVGVKGTPSFIVKTTGDTVPGAVPKEQFFQLLDSALEKVSVSSNSQQDGQAIQENTSSPEVVQNQSEQAADAVENNSAQ